MNKLKQQLYEHKKVIRLEGSYKKCKSTKVFVMLITSLFLQNRSMKNTKDYLNFFKYKRKLLIKN